MFSENVLEMLCSFRSSFDVLLIWLIQNFIADAAATTAAQNPSGPPPSSQGYNPYPGHIPSYPSQPPPPGHAPAAAGDYGSAVYGGNYGY